MLGGFSGALGTLAVLRRQSLIGDAVSHAALPGIVLAFMLTGSKVSLVLLIGAALSGWLAVLWVMGLVKTTRLKFDAALGVALSVFFGLGLVLLTVVQRQSGAAQAGLDRYLFGKAATLLKADVITIMVLGLVALMLVLLLWKELKLLIFDSEYAASLGYPIHWLDILLTGLLVVAIVIGLQAVGVVLMSALLIAPAVAARQWTHRFGRMFILAGILGLLAGGAGAVISSLSENIPTGPVIILIATGASVFSILLAPARGLLWRFWRLRRHRTMLSAMAVLEALYRLADHHEDVFHPHDLSAIRLAVGRSYAVKRLLERLAGEGLVEKEGKDRWRLTERGLAQVKDDDQHSL